MPTFTNVGLIMTLKRLAVVVSNCGCKAHNVIKMVLSITSGCIAADISVALQKCCKLAKKRFDSTVKFLSVMLIFVMCE